MATPHLTEKMRAKRRSDEKKDAPYKIELNDLSEDDLCFISGHWNLPPECAIVSNRRVDLYDRGFMPSTIN